MPEASSSQPLEKKGGPANKKRKVGEKFRQHKSKVQKVGCT